MERLDIAGTRVDIEAGRLTEVVRRRYVCRYGRFSQGMGHAEYVFHLNDKLPAAALGPGAPISRTSEGSLVVAGAKAIGELDPVSGTACAAVDPYLYSLDALLRTAVTLSVLKRGGCLFHAAGAVVEGVAYLFPGPSGAGKSTLASIAKNPLSDEICVVLPEGSGFTVHPTPWWIGRASSALLGGVCALCWNGESLVGLSRAAGLRHLTAHIALSVDEPATRASAFRTAGQIAAAVPFGRLTFTKQTDLETLLSNGWTAA